MWQCCYRKVYFIDILNNSPSNEHIELVNRNLAECYIRMVFNFGYLYNEQEEYRKGLDALSKSLKKSINNSQRSKSYSLTGECYLGLNNNVEAFDNLKRARDLLNEMIPNIIIIERWENIMLKEYNDLIYYIIECCKTISKMF